LLTESRCPARAISTPWLGTRQTLTTLPTVASLKALRCFSEISRARKPYLGIGNPLLVFTQTTDPVGSGFVDSLANREALTVTELIERFEGGVATERRRETQNGPLCTC
jgi:hypothetical protein